jgi:hypothetical protein
MAFKTIAELRLLLSCAILIDDDMVRDSITMEVIRNELELETAVLANCMENNETFPLAVLICVGVST